MKTPIRAAVRNAYCEFSTTALIALKHRTLLHILFMQRFRNRCFFGIAVQILSISALLLC